MINFGTRVETTTTPAGRVTSSLFDAQGKILQIDPPDDASIFFSYDTQGRLLSTQRGTPPGKPMHEMGFNAIEEGDPLNRTYSSGRSLDFGPVNLGCWNCLEYFDTCISDFRRA